MISRRDSMLAGRAEAIACARARLAAETMVLTGGWIIQPAVGSSRAGRHVGWEVHAPLGYGGPWYTAKVEQAMDIYSARSRLPPRKIARSPSGPTDPTGPGDRNENADGMTI